MNNQTRKRRLVIIAIVVFLLLVASLYMAFKSNNHENKNPASVATTSQYKGLNNLLQVGVSDGGVNYFKSSISEFMIRNSIPNNTPVSLGGVTHKHFTEKGYDTYDFTIFIGSNSYYVNLKTEALQPTSLQLYNGSTNKLIFSAD